MVEKPQTDNGEAEQSVRCAYQVQLEKLKSMSKERATGLAAYLVDMAKTKALNHMGDNQCSRKPARHNLQISVNSAQHVGIQGSCN